MSYLKLVLVLAGAASIGLLPNGRAAARGVGQAEHDADNFISGSYSGGAGMDTSKVGQAQQEARYVGGGYGVSAGPDTSKVGQAQEDDVGNRGYSRPLFFGEGRSLIAGQSPGTGPVASNPRYGFADGHWWYWLPSDQWVFWENGAWHDYNVAIAQSEAGPNGTRLFSYEPSPDKNGNEGKTATDVIPQPPAQPPAVSRTPCGN